MNNDELKVALTHSALMEADKDTLRELDYMMRERLLTLDAELRVEYSPAAASEFDTLDRDIQGVRAVWSAKRYEELQHLPLREVAERLRIVQEEIKRRQHAREMTNIADLDLEAGVLASLRKVKRGH